MTKKSKAVIYEEILVAKLFNMNNVACDKQNYAVVPYIYSISSDGFLKFLKHILNVLTVPERANKNSPTNKIKAQNKNKKPTVPLDFHF